MTEQTEQIIIGLVLEKLATMKKLSERIEFLKSFGMEISYAEEAEKRINERFNNYIRSQRNRRFMQEFDGTYIGSDGCFYEDEDQAKYADERDALNQLREIHYVPELKKVLLK